MKKLIFFLILLFISNTMLCQDEEVFYTLEGASNKIKRWLQNDLYDITAGGIFEFTARFTKYSSKLKKLYEEANSSFTSAQDYLDKQIEAQTGKEAIDVYYDFVNNPYSAEQQYLNKYFTLNGFISRIDRDNNGDLFLLLSERFKCYFSESKKHQLIDLGVGYSCVVRGKIFNYLSYNVDKLILLKDCSIVEQSNFFEEKNKIWKNLETYLVNYSSTLDQIVKGKSKNIDVKTENINNEGKSKIDIKDENIEPHFDVNSSEALKYDMYPQEFPEPIGGMKEFQSRIVYPESAKRGGLEGKVFVLAFIDENGDVKFVSLTKGLNAVLNDAALKVVKNTKFKPGMKSGKPIKTQYVIPVIFKLQ